MVENIEILAPAGSEEALKAAVENGADAVYLGGKDFSARQFASNFSDEQLCEAVKYCHVRGVKIYVAVNTLIRGNEFEEVLRYLLFLYKLGVDAVIVQDLGLVSAVGYLLPELDIHASTQMTVHNSKGVTFLSGYGVERVILAREVSLEDIKKIGAKTDVALETFVHGALCFAYSGQCLLGSLVGGRSGNRGKCPQPCRMKYTLIDRLSGAPVPGFEETYLLSTKDLKTITVLPYIIASGVKALKIEGRMKRPEYVAVVVEIYKNVLRRYFEDPDNYYVTEEEENKLAQVFNRGFTAGYYFGDPGEELISYARPNNRGIFTGRVSGCSKQLLKIKTETDINKDDKLEIWIKSGGRKIVTVKELFDREGKPVSKGYKGDDVCIPVNTCRGIKNNDRVFKVHDEALMNFARKTFTSPKSKRKIPIEIEVEVRLGEPMCLKGVDANGNEVEVKTTFKAEKAKKRPLTKKLITKQIDRLGNTPFYIQNIVIDIKDQLMVPVSEINKARQELIAEIERLRWTAFQPESWLDEKKFKAAINKMIGERQAELKTKTQKKIKSKLSINLEGEETAKEAVRNGADRIYLSAECFKGEFNDLNAVINSIKTCKDSGTEVFCCLPRIWHEGELAEIEEYIDSTLPYNPTGYTAANPGSLQLLHEKGVKNIHGDYPFNIFNVHSAYTLINEGVNTFTLSPELNLSQMKELSDICSLAENIVHGALPLMVAEHSILSRDSNDKPFCFNTEGLAGNKYALKDRMDLLFPIEFDSKGRTYIFNSKEFCLAERLSEVRALGLKYLRIEASKDSVSYVSKVVRIYRKLIDSINNGALEDLEINKAEEQLAVLSPYGFTKGHYFRGVE